MIEEPNFVPFIRTASWSGVEDCFVRPLLTDDPELVIAYGQLGKSSVTYLTKGGRKGSELSDEELNTRAIRNMLKIPGRPNWQEHKLGGESYALRVGNELVASGILNAKGLHRLNDFFAAPTIYLGLPCLFTMAASTHRGMLSGIVKGLYEDAQRDAAGPICARLLVIKDGKIQGFASAAAEETAGAAPAREAQVGALSQGLGATWMMIEHAKGTASADAVPTQFLAAFKRRLGAGSPELTALLADAEAGVAEAAATARKTKSAINRIEGMAATLRAALGPAAFEPVGRAVLAAASDIGQSGTGFFGIGRKLPESLRVVVRALSGVLGVSDAPAPKS
jgi:hypothetical protein